jgi:hypothetical protein
MDEGDVDSEFFRLFPFGISSRSSFVRKAFNGAIRPPYVSAVWRHFLIVFASTRSSILQASNWIPIIQDSRLAFSRLASESSDQVARLKKTPNYLVATRAIMEAYMTITNSLDVITLNAVLAVVSHLIDQESTAASIRTICCLASHLHYQFSMEAQAPGGKSPKSTLLDRAFVLHDVFSCVRTLLPTFALFFHAGRVPAALHDLYSQLEWTIQDGGSPGLDCGGLRPFMSGIIELYQTLFARYLPRRDDLLAIWSILFANVGDISIFHRFYSCIWKTSAIALPDVAELPMVLYVEQVRRWILGVDKAGRGDELRKASAVVEELVDVLDTEDNRQRRTVLKYAVSQIILVARGKLHMDEVVPASVLLMAVT